MKFEILTEETIKEIKSDIRYFVSYMFVDKNGGQGFSNAVVKSKNLIEGVTQLRALEDFIQSTIDYADVQTIVILGLTGL